MGKEIFSNVQLKIEDLLRDVKNGRIGLPDLQRPFVWKDAKVRDLLDSMMKGYPVGYIVLWASPEEYEHISHIGRNEKVYRQPDDLVIDGQQRLTALLAALYGITIKDKNYKERKIRISFSPLTKEFAVWTPAYEKDPEWISAISEVFKAYEEHAESRFRKNYIRVVNETRMKNNRPELTEDEEDQIERNIKELLDLNMYSIPTLKISAAANEEDVSDIFVRVNSGGQKLTEKNFIETLLAVYDNDVHVQINKFCEASRVPAVGTSYNPIIDVESSYLIRVAVGIGFRRARLRYAYMLLRGKDLKTGEITQRTREENLKIFKDSLNLVTDLNNWHEFVNIFRDAGYQNSSLVASSNAVVFCYVLYLIGKYDYKVKPMELRKIIRKWIFMSTVTLFYTGSTESEVEKQFADLRNVHTAEEFVAYLEAGIKTKFTDEYFRVTLPEAMASAGAQSPAWYGYVAALNVLGTPVLFGTMPISQYFQLGSSGTKKSIDKHHIFPKAYLGKIGVTSDRDRNQIANFTYLDYSSNIDISDQPPQDYVAKYREKLGETGYRIACEEHALPENFETMDYFDFLKKRRVLMAQTVKKAYERLCQ